MFHLPLTSATIDFQWSPAIGMGVDSVHTPGEVSFRSTRLAPPPCHDATPKNTALRAAEAGPPCTPTVPAWPSAAGASLLFARTLPPLRGIGVTRARSATAPPATMATTGIARVLPWT